MTGLAGKNPRKEKPKTYLDKQSLWLKRMILREQEIKCFSVLIWTHRGTKMFLLT